MQTNDIGKFVQSAAKLPGRATSAPSGLSRGQPIQHPVKRLKQAPSAANGNPTGADPQAAIAALEARVDELQAQLELLMGSVRVDPSGSVTISTGGRVDIQAGVIGLSASLVNVDSGVVNCSGVVKCDSIIANTVVGSSYTPGAGNIW